MEGLIFNIRNIMCIMLGLAEEIIHNVKLGQMKNVIF